MGHDPVPGTAQTPPRVWAVADSDSYAKWAASTLERLPADWERRLLVLTGTASPSRAQIAAAVAGTSLEVGPTVTLGELGVALRGRPDVLLVATRGATAQTLRETVLTMAPQRPAILTGLPGVSVPATQKALDYRCFADGFVVHAVREVDEFEALASGGPLEGRILLSSLPFAAEITGPPAQEARVSAREEIVFAAQAGVPRGRADREELVRILVRAAEAHADARLVIKVRALPGEVQTHAETHPLPELLDDLVRQGEVARPVNLTVEAGPMAEHLAHARALVTVSSTAAIEALAAGVPVLILDDFGVSAALINDVFRESGLLGDAGAFAAGDFRMPTEEWARRHYFHSPSDNVLEPQILALAAAAREGELRGLPDVAPSRRAMATRAYARFSAFGGRTGRLRDQVWAVWFKARRVLRGAVRRVQRLLPG